jgi:hypothetical protein
VVGTSTGPQARFPQRRAMTRMGHGGLTAADYADVEHMGEIMDPETRSKKASTCVSQVIVESAYCGLSSGGMAANKVTAVHAALELFQAMT